MWNAAFAGAVALAMTGMPLAAQEMSANNLRPVVQREAQAPMLTSGQIARFRAALRLRPEQEQYWPAVARALHGMMRQSTGDGHGGLVQRFGARASEMVSDVAGLRRLAAAAMPLVRSMDDEQKLIAMRLVDEMGYGAIVAQF